jgi:hypothetical protein
MGTDSAKAWWVADELNGTLIDLVPGGERTIEIRASDRHPEGWAPYDQDQLPLAGDPVWASLSYHEVAHGGDYSATVQGRYVQYRVTLHSDATHTFSPDLYRVFIGADPGASTDPLADVSGLQATPGNRQVTLSWQLSTSPDVVEQIVRVYDGATLVDLVSLDDTTTTVTVSGLSNDQVYTFTVSVSDGWGESRGVTVAAEPSDAQAPPDVTNLVVAPGRQRLHLSWTLPADPENDIAGIRVYHRLSAGGTDTLDATLGSGATSYTILGLSDGTEYLVTVKTADIVPNESEGAWDTGTPANVSAPEEVTDLGTIAGDGRVDLRWTASADSEDDLARLRLYVNDGTGYDAGRNLAADAVYHQVAGLDNGTSYAFLITTVDTAGNESQGVVTNATPKVFDDYWHNPLDSSWQDAFGYHGQGNLQIRNGEEIVLTADGIYEGGATFSSAVHDFGENGAKICWRARELRATSISWVKVRTSLHPPLTNIDNQPWQQDERPADGEWPGASSWSQVFNGSGGDFPEGRYVQYQVRLSTDPDRRYSPVLRYALLSTDDGSDCSPPEDVTDLVAVAGDGHAYFTWTESANSEGDLARQTIYYSTDNGFTWSKGAALDPFATYYRANNLTNFVEYIFRITASDIHGNESLGTTVVARPEDNDPPDPISNLAVTFAGDTAYLS